MESCAVGEVSGVGVSGGLDGVMRWVIPAILLLLAGFTLFLRAWRLNSIPPWLWADEAAQGLNARDLLTGHLQAFFPRGMGQEPFYAYLTTPFVAAWDGQPFAVRIVAALLSALMVLALYLAARALWRDRPYAGVWAGVAAAGFWATNFWPQSMGRIGFQVNTLPLILTLAVVFWLCYTQQPTRRRAITFGLLAGLTMATYLAARITPVLWILLYLALPKPKRQLLRTTLPWARWLAHSVPAPKASPVAATSSVLVGLPLSGSIRVIVPSPVFATQTEPAA